MKNLYKLGGTAALIIVALVLVQIIVFVAWPPPVFESDVSTVIDYFMLFQSNRVLGLLHLDLLLMVDYVLLVLMFLALFIVLRRISQSFMAIAMTLVFVGIAVAYFPSNTAFSMLSLSDHYAAATTEAHRTMLLGAGQAILTSLQSTTFYVSYVLMFSAGLIISVVMLKSNNIFSKVTAYVGILASVLGLGLFVPNSRSPPLAHFSHTYGDVVHPDSPKAFPVELASFERRYVSKG